VEWFFNHSYGSSTISGGTAGGLSLATNGFTLTYTGPNLTANFEAFASNNKVNILSRPRLVARSGSEAEIQVGTDVPIITSQAASPVQANGATTVLQSVEYRQTGIILDIKPFVYGDNRVDLTVSQEVSDAEANSNSAIASPLILDRSIKTQLSLTEGATAVLGGLIDDEYTKGNIGVPILKDIPIIGTAFRTDTVSGNKTELVILVTPFIINDPDDMAGVASSLSDEINKAFKVGRGWSYTLTAFSTGHNLGINLPPAHPVPLNPPTSAAN
jgi:general secretion pathway protein D